MIALILRRFFDAAFMLIILASVTFLAVFFLGDGVDMFVPPDLPEAARLRMIESMGLSGGFSEQYTNFMLGLLKGDLGLSFLHHMPPFTLILSRLTASLELALLAIVCAFIIGAVWGLLASFYKRHFFARFLKVLTLLGIAMPSYALGLLLVALFSLYYGLLPSIGRGETVDVFGLELSLFTLDGLRHLILPLLTLIILKASLFARVAYSATEELQHAPFIRQAKARGLSTYDLLTRHYFKNMFFPLLSVAALEFGSLITFLIVTESLFSWPGVGRLFIEAIHYLDRPMLVAYVIFVGMTYILLNFFVDVVGMMLDKREKKRA